MIGIDEVGRGAWAGPLLVVAARQRKDLSTQICDSKKISHKQRIKLIENIIDSCDLGEGWVESDEVDSIGLSEAMRVGVNRALMELNAKYIEEIIIDGNINYCNKKYFNSKAIIKADLNIPIVSAASIFAKVRRDRYMYKLAEDFPDYGFETNVGYGTKTHIEGIKKYGPTLQHRFSFKPIAKFVVN